MGWNDPLTTLWVQRDGAAELTIGGLTLNDLPVYVLSLPVDETGKVLDASEVQVYAVADISVIRVHCSNGSVLGLTGIPTVHIVKIGVSPSTAVVEICISASRKRNEIDFRLLSCGKGGSRAKSDKCGQAHHERKQSCNSSLEKMCFHCVDYLLENEKRTVQ